MNSFMRNVISDDGHYEDSDDFTKTNSYSSKNKMGNKQTSDGGIVLQRNAADVKQMYVKKS